MILQFYILENYEQQIISINNKINYFKTTPTSCSLKTEYRKLLKINFEKVYFY